MKVIQRMYVEGADGWQGNITLRLEGDSIDLIDIPDNPVETLLFEGIINTPTFRRYRDLDIESRAKLLSVVQLKIKKPSGSRQDRGDIFRGCTVTLKINKDRQQKVIFEGTITDIWEPAIFLA